MTKLLCEIKGLQIKVFNLTLTRLSIECFQSTDDLKKGNVHFVESFNRKSLTSPKRTNSNKE